MAYQSGEWSKFEPRIENFEQSLNIFSINMECRISAQLNQSGCGLCLSVRCTETQSNLLDSGYQMI